ncbi:MAG: SDR family NAD(P)-dependent oxidoreductase [Anaerolineae bacterium]|nr:SDR family NAD(P)-dependent oxidoreductase [Anaerolineae bacterium]
MYPELRDKVVLITGASGALGHAVVLYFARAGARIVGIDRSSQRFVESLGADYSADWLVIETDLLVSAQIEQMVETVLAQRGSVDVLINLAGGYYFGKALETPKIAGILCWTSTRKRLSWPAPSWGGPWLRGARGGALST